VIELEKVKNFAQKLADQNKNTPMYKEILQVIDRVTMVKKLISDKGGNHE
jgi:hypothetical protein